jgi:3',5'-cyclic AMP phosphodiesterase CpdA
MKIVQVSDTHLTRRGGVTEHNFNEIVAFVNDVLRPDLVVHTGDAVVLDPDALDDHRHARDLVARFAAPVRVVPGNHDIGDGGVHPWKGIGVSEERVAAFESLWGPDRWHHDLDGWTVLGLNSEVLGSGLHREAEQWRWLESTIAALPADRPVLVFLHKPVWPAIEGPTDHQVDVGDAPRARLLDLFGRLTVKAVGSGHLHRYRQTVRGGTTEVWAPSTAGLARAVDDRLPAALHQLGVVEYECDGAEVQVRFRAPVGLVEGDLPGVPELAVAMAEIDGRRPTTVG